MGWLDVNIYYQVYKQTAALHKSIKEIFGTTECGT